MEKDARRMRLFLGSVEGKQYRKSSMKSALSTLPLKPLDIFLLRAVEENDLISAQKWLNEGADINCHLEYRETPLHIAAECGQLDLIRLLCTNPKICMEMKTLHGQTALFFAVKSGNIEAVKVLLRKGANVNTQDDMDSTPLHLATFMARMDIIKLLLEYKADVNAIDAFGKSPLHISVLDQPHPMITRLLLRSGAQADTQDHGLCLLMEALLSARTKHDLLAIDLLIRYGADVNMIDPVGMRSPLHVTAQTNNADAAKLLLNHGADTAAINCFGQTPLDVAAMRKHWKVIKLLMNYPTYMDTIPEQLFRVNPRMLQKALQKRRCVKVLNVATTHD